MTDTNEIRALKASLRGALDAAVALEAVRPMVEALADDAEIGEADLEELGRATAGHAVASQALRGLVVTMRNRRTTATA